MTGEGLHVSQDKKINPQAADLRPARHDADDSGPNRKLENSILQGTNIGVVVVTPGIRSDNNWVG